MPCAVPPIVTVTVLAPLLGATPPRRGLVGLGRGRRRWLGGDGQRVEHVGEFTCTLGSGANRGVLVVGGTTGISGTIGGEALTIISGTDGGATTGTVCLGKATTLTGGQTLAMSWTTSQNYVIGCIPLAGVNQTTPFNNGAATATYSASITSTTGDLTASLAWSTTDVTTNQTQRFNITQGSLRGAGDTGPGTGTVTRTWTGGSGGGTSRVNIVQSTAAAVGLVNTTPLRSLVNGGLVR